MKTSSHLVAGVGYVLQMVCLSLFTANTHAANWPRFRGPDGQGISNDTGLPTQWSETKNVAWKRELPGPGSSSPITWGDRIYVTCYTGYGLDKANPGNQQDLRRHLVCLDRRDGQVLWKRTHEGTGTEFPYTGFMHTHGYASHTPVADNDGVYAYLGTSGAVAYTHDGKLRWKKSCGTGNSGSFGSGCSPVLYENSIIINAGQERTGMVALDKETGKELWKFRWAYGLCQPTIVGTGESRAIVLGRERSPTRGYDPKTGEMLWECETKLGNYMPMALAHDGIAFATNLKNTAAIRLGGRGKVTGTHKLWEIDTGSHVATMIYYEDHLYFVNDHVGVVYCLDAETGDIVFKERLQPRPGNIWAAPVIADGKLYFVSRFKGAFVLAAKPVYELLAHNSIANDDSHFHGTPAISNGQLILRSNRYLYCIGER